VTQENLAKALNVGGRVRGVFIIREFYRRLMREAVGARAL
jgi:hypothetical protein